MSIVVGPVPVSAAGATTARPLCGPASARTERAGHLTRVFSRINRYGDRSFFACLKGHRSYRLGVRYVDIGDTGDGAFEYGFARYAIAGPYVAWGFNTGANDFGDREMSVQTRDLRNGRVVMAPQVLGNESNDRADLDRIDLDRRGHASWTVRHTPAGLPAPPPPRPEGIAVYRDPRCGQTLLADVTGSSHAPTQLRLRAGDLRWTIGAVVGRAELCPTS